MVRKESVAPVGPRCLMKDPDSSLNPGRVLVGRCCCKYTNRMQDLDWAVVNELNDTLADAYLKQVLGLQVLLQGQS